MSESLSEEEYLKIQDLRRIYATSGVAEFLNVKRSVVELVLIRINGEQAVGIRPDVAKRIRSGIRQYWKAWMSKYRRAE